MSIPDDFITLYLKRYAFYKEAPRLCAEPCEAILERNGIRSIVMYRAKRPDRLHAKVEQREAALSKVSAKPEPDAH